MNRILPEMLHCLQTSGNIAGNCTDMTVLEQQRGRLKWQQQQQNQQSHQENEQQSYFNDTHFNNILQLPSINSNFDLSFINNNNDSMMIRDLVNGSIKTDPNFDNGWPDFGKYRFPRTGFTGDNTATDFGTNSLEMANYSISRTSSCLPVVADVLPAVGVAVVAEEKSREIGLSEKMASTVGKESFKKRKADKAQNPKVWVVEDQTREKKIKVDTEELESKITNEQKNNRENSAESSKENSKVSEVQKSDYIHVRARRGQATDSHSLAERVRREKISERMKYLQDLVPGCNKITGKAGMLDEIINYVQSLQKQVEFLSMKLAAVNPRLDFNINNFFTKDMFPSCTGIFPATVGMSQEMANCQTYLQSNSIQEIVASCGLDMVIDPPEMAALRRTISAPVTVPETFLDTSCFTQEQPTLTWETDLQNLYSMEEFHQGRTPTVFPPQSFTGTMEVNNNLKMEM